MKLFGIGSVLLDEVVVRIKHGKKTSIFPGVTIVSTHPITKHITIWSQKEVEEYVAVNGSK